MYAMNLLVRTTGARAGWSGLLFLAACTPDDPPHDKACTAEIPYDGVDQDCDGADLVDQDQDGHDADTARGDDCDDGVANVHPGATEVPYDGIDQDCVDGDLVDVDGDGEPAEVAGGEDCDDDDPDRHSTSTDDVGDDTDQNCDGLDGVDADADGHASIPSGGTDCADDDPGRNAAATEVWYDGVDQDCDGWCDYDQDGDGGVLVGSPVPNGSPCDLVAGAGTYAPTDCNDVDPDALSLVVSDTQPSDAEPAAPVDQPLVAWLTEPYPTPVFALTDAGGNAVPGTLAGTGTEELVFSPDAPLQYLGHYEMSVTHGCGTQTFTFETEAEPMLIDPAIAIGRTWSIDLEDGAWIEPAGLEGLILTYVYGTLLVEVIGASDDTLDLRIAATADGIGQDTCVETVDTAGDFAANPRFTAGPADFSLSGPVVPIDIESGTITATVQPDGASINRVTFDGVIDTAPLGEPLGLGSNPAAACNILFVYGATCVPCPDGAGPYCLPIRIEDASGVDSAAAVVPRTAADIAADATCP